MPCWYYDKVQLSTSPSMKTGLDRSTEMRYRREGARFIMDAGTSLGLRFDTCATGVVYFHRFYQFHSFQEFHRYVTAACCLFLAGKVEETPKKCKDIIKVTRGKLTDKQFMVFGDDPKEEVIMMERILLQTIKFDLQLEHPYAYLLRFAKELKGDKAKIQKIVQMGWTFINDSLCTTLSLQWEPDLIAVALMYLASRLSKFDISDWNGKVPGQKGKWFDHLVEDASLELLEDICHQVLDLYSQTPQKTGEESPPPPPPPKPGTQPPKQAVKRARSATPVEHSSQGNNSAHAHQKSRTPSPAPKRERESKESARQRQSQAKKAEPQKAQPPPKVTPAKQHPPVVQQKSVDRQRNPEQHSRGEKENDQKFTSENPYMSRGMYSSSFMSQEGSQAIHSLIGGGAGGGGGGGGRPPPTQQQPQQNSGYGSSYNPSHSQQPQAQQQGQYPPQPQPLMGSQQSTPYPQSSYNSPYPQTSQPISGGAQQSQSGYQYQQQQQQPSSQQQQYNQGYSSSSSYSHSTPQGGLYPPAQQNAPTSVSQPAINQAPQQGMYSQSGGYSQQQTQAQPQQGYNQYSQPQQQSTTSYPPSQYNTSQSYQQQSNQYQTQAQQPQQQPHQNYMQPQQQHTTSGRAPQQQGQVQPISTITQVRISGRKY